MMRESAGNVVGAYPGLPALGGRLPGTRFALIQAYMVADVGRNKGQRPVSGNPTPKHRP